MPVNFKRSQPMSCRIRRDEPHDLKHHFPKGAVREVMGYLSLQAVRDPERFVFAGIDDIVAHCNRYKGSAYQRRMVEYAQEYLRELRIISKSVERQRWVFGHLRTLRGVIVTPHDSLCFQPSASRCNFVGWDQAGGTWRSDGEPDGVRWWVPSRHVSTTVEREGAESGAVQGAESGAVTGAEEKALGCGVGCGRKSPKGAEKGADTFSSNSIEAKELER